MSDAKDDWFHRVMGVHPSMLRTDNPAPVKLPMPMQPDCKPVHGKLNGPDNHVLCGPHGHVLDIKAKTIIAHTVDDYYTMQQAVDAVNKANTAIKKGLDQAAHLKAEGDKKRAEFHKTLGLRPTDVFLTVETVDGPAPDLNITMTAENTCPGPNLGVEGFARFKFTGSSFIAKQQDLPPIGMASFSVFATTGNKIELKFNQVAYDVSKGGTLKLAAVERAMHGSETDSANRGSTHEQGDSKADTTSSESEGGLDIKVAKVGGKAGFSHQHQSSTSDGTSEGTGTSDTRETVLHSAIYDVHVIK